MSWVFGFQNLPLMLRDTVLEHMSSKVLILPCMNVFFLFVGMWMTDGPAILLFAPIMMPLAESVGMHPFTWGIIMVLVLVLGLITPPMALVLFAASDIAGLPMERVFKAAIPLFLQCSRCCATAEYLSGTDAVPAAPVRLYHMTAIPGPVETPGRAPRRDEPQTLSGSRDM